MLRTPTATFLTWKILFKISWIIQNGLPFIVILLLLGFSLRSTQRHSTQRAWRIHMEFVGSCEIGRVSGLSALGLDAFGS